MHIHRLTWEHPPRGDLSWAEAFPVWPADHQRVYSRYRVRLTSCHLSFATSSDYFYPHLSLSWLSEWMVDEWALSPLRLPQHLAQCWENSYSLKFKLNHVLTLISESWSPPLWIGIWNIIYNKPNNNSNKNIFSLCLWKYIFFLFKEK